MFSRLLNTITFRYLSPSSTPSCTTPDCNICKNMLVATGDKNWQEHSKKISIPVPRLFPIRINSSPASNSNLKPVTRLDPPPETNSESSDPPTYSEHFTAPTVVVSDVPNSATPTSTRPQSMTNLNVLNILPEIRPSSSIYSQPVTPPNAAILNPTPPLNARPKLRLSTNPTTLNVLPEIRPSSSIYSQLAFIQSYAENSTLASPSSNPPITPHLLHPLPQIRPTSSIYSRPTIPGPTLTSLASPDTEKPLPSLPKRPTWILAFDTTLLLLTLALLALSSASAQQLLSAPLASTHLPAFSTTYDTPPSTFQSRPSTTAWIVLYSLSMPILSYLATLLSLALWFCRRSSAMFAAVRSMSFLAGWIVCLAVWMECDWDSGRYYSSKDYGLCYQTRLILDSQGGLVGVSTSLMEAKISFAIVIAVVYLAYFVSSVWKIPLRR